MKHSTKIIIALVIGIIFIIVMAIAMFMFVNNNSTSEEVQEEAVVEETSVIGDEEFTNEILLYDIASFGVSQTDDGTYLVKINDDLETEAFANLNCNEDLTFVDYDYSDGKVYIMYSINTSVQIYSIDLENYDTELVVELDDSDDCITSYLDLRDEADAFYVCDDKIYYLVDQLYIYEYDMETMSKNIIIDISKDYYDEETDTYNYIYSFDIDKNNNIIYYAESWSGESGNSHVYKFNVEEETEEEVLNVENFCIWEINLNDNYLVCEVTEDGSSFTYYVYNIDDESVWELGANDNGAYCMLGGGNVAFTDDYIMLSDSEKIILSDYDGETVGEIAICEDNEFIYEIVNLTTDKIQVIIAEDSVIGKVILIDFTYDTLEEVEGSYSKVLKIK